jgi:hypothetical protein
MVLSGAVNTGSISYPVTRSDVATDQLDDSTKRRHSPDLEGDRNRRFKNELATAISDHLTGVFEKAFGSPSVENGEESQNVERLLESISEKLYKTRALGKKTRLK